MIGGVVATAASVVGGWCRFGWDWGSKTPCRAGLGKTGAANSRSAGELTVDLPDTVPSLHADVLRRLGETHVRLDPMAAFSGDGVSPSELPRPAERVRGRVRQPAAGAALCRLPDYAD